MLRDKNENQIEARRIKQYWDGILSGVSSHPLFPVLYDVKFLGLSPVLDMYTIFCDEPWNTFYIGISKMRNQWLCDRLWSSHLYT